MCKSVHKFQRKGGRSVTNRNLSAKEVAELLGIAESTAYAVIRGWNKELKAQGYFTKAGSVPRAYFEKKCYGYGEAQQMNFDN